jgi:transcriptional regulator with XRE-family HTH domain
MEALKEDRPGGGDVGRHAARRSDAARRPDVARRSDLVVAAEIALLQTVLAFGREIRVSRRRRRLSQQALADRVGISRPALSSIELGKNTGVLLRTCVALGTALGRQLQVGLSRDAADEPPDAGHLSMQELVLRLGRPAGYTGRFELPTRPSDPTRSTDVNLLDRTGRRMVLAECWNSFGDLGAAARSSSRKLAEAKAFAIAHGGEDGPWWSARAGSSEPRRGIGSWCVDIRISSTHSSPDRRAVGWRP